MPIANTHFLPLIYIVQPIDHKKQSPFRDSITRNLLA